MNIGFLSERYQLLFYECKRNYFINLEINNLIVEYFPTIKKK
ncbi:hypothetical protein H4V97_000972 [Flavobacterium sp. CG_23.5]|nr:hypothetical protein [Flavobacterium sp. CG_23.5]